MTPQCETIILKILHSSPIGFIPDMVNNISKKKKVISFEIKIVTRFFHEYLWYGNEFDMTNNNIYETNMDLEGEKKLKK